MDKGASVTAYRALFDDIVPCKPDRDGSVVEGTITEVDVEQGTILVFTGVEDGDRIHELCAIEGAKITIR